MSYDAPNAYVIECEGCGVVEVAVSPAEPGECRALTRGEEVLAKYGCLHDPRRYVCRPKWYRICLDL